MNKKKVLKIILVILACFIVLCIALVFGVNAYVKHIGGVNIITPEYAAELKDVDCIIVLGCQVKDNGKPSDMLADRLTRGIDLYNQGIAPKIIMSGDHGQIEYDEVNTMKRYLVDKGIPSEVVYMDHAGLSTYDTMYRAVNIFSVKKAIIVTQQYHMYRALFDARALGIDAYGVCSVKKQYGGQAYRDIREVAARIKDLGYSIFKPSSEVKGEKISLSESGDVTND